MSQPPQPTLARRAARALRAASVPALAALIGLTVLGCDGLAGGGFDCATQENGYSQATANSGALNAEVPAEGPFPMAMVLSQTGVNNLLQAVVGQNLPAIEVKDFGFDITIQPTIPQLAIDSVQGCPTCIIGQLGFEISGEDIGEGSGALSVSLPMAMTPSNSNPTVTRVMANMNKADIVNLSLDLGENFSIDDYPFLDTLLEEALSSYVRSELGATELLRLDSWQISDDVLVAARTPVVFPDNDTILVGMHTNLALAPTATLEEQGVLPDGAQMGLQFHPELVLGMVERMMVEGNISSSYNASGGAEANGDHQVSLTSMTASTDGSDALATSFRIWRTGGGLCGTADIATDLAAQISGDQIQFSAQNLRVVGGSGIGEVFSASQWLAGDFIQGLTDNAAFTVNYDSMDLGGDSDSVKPKANALTINNQGLSVFLDLDIVTGN